MKDPSSGMEIIISQALGSKGLEVGPYKELIKLEMAPEHGLLKRWICGLQRIARKEHALLEWK